MAVWHAVCLFKNCASPDLYRYRQLSILSVSSTTPSQRQNTHIATHVIIAFQHAIWKSGPSSLMYVIANPWPWRFPAVALPHESTPRIADSTERTQSRIYDVACVSLRRRGRGAGKMANPNSRQPLHLT